MENKILNNSREQEIFPRKVIFPFGGYRSGDTTEYTPDFTEILDS